LQDKFPKDVIVSIVVFFEIYKDPFNVILFVCKLVTVIELLVIEVAIIETEVIPLIIQLFENMEEHVILFDTNVEEFKLLEVIFVVSILFDVNKDDVILLKIPEFPDKF
jgi:hypothetical protein